MSDISSLTSQPMPLRGYVKDETGKPTGEVLEYMVHPLSFNEIGSLQSWIDRQFPDPIQRTQESIDQARERGKPFTTAQEQFLYKAAQELAMRSRHLIGTPEADQLLMSVDGTKQMIALSIRKGKPDFTDAEAERFFNALMPLDFIKLYQATQINLVLDLEDPKVGTLDLKPTAKPNGVTMSRRQRRAKKKSTGGQSITG